MRQEIYQPDGTLVSVEDVPDELWERDRARESALAKLQALGLTEAEALAMIGG